jgi:hypothetical protein
MKKNIFVFIWNKVIMTYFFFNILDNIKNTFCEKYNIKLLRIPYTEKDNIL